MAFFFFFVGLEIKREITSGELSSMSRAALPIMGAVGGMAVPALVYVAFNLGPDGFPRGWGVPMATDIAFALGVLVLMGKRAPLGLKVFLTALAIVDDLGAVMVIAVFYTSQLALNYLFAGLGLVVLLGILNKLGVRHRWVYLAAALLVWYCFLQSGVHATIAGVLVAMTVPHQILGDRKSFLQTLAESKYVLEKAPDDVTEHTAMEQRQVALSAIERAAERWGSPLHRLEHDAAPFVTYFIMPVFAFANAGVQLPTNALSSLMQPVPLGIVAGLLLGKTLGIFALSKLAVQLRWADLPPGVSWGHLLGASALGGIGFSMSLFIANLAFPSGDLLELSKTGILLGSLLSAVAGVLLIRSTKEPAPTVDVGSETVEIPVDAAR